MRVSDQGGRRMLDSAQTRAVMIEHLVSALGLAEEMNEPNTGFLIERALDEARGILSGIGC
jgi:hypothetical protein